MGRLTVQAEAGMNCGITRCSGYFPPLGCWCPSGLASYLIPCQIDRFAGDWQAKCLLPYWECFAPNVKGDKKEMKIAASFIVLALALTFSTSVFAADSGADLYKTKCAMCHGPDGKGETAMGKRLGIKDLGSADVQKQSDADLTTVVTKGKGKMPGYEGKLTGDQIQELVKFISTLKK